LTATRGRTLLLQEQHALEEKIAWLQRGYQAVNKRLNEVLEERAQNTAPSQGAERGGHPNAWRGGRRRW